MLLLQYTSSNSGISSGTDDIVIVLTESPERNMTVPSNGCRSLLVLVIFQYTCDTPIVPPSLTIDNITCVESVIASFSTTN